MIPHQPLNFSGKIATVTYQTVTKTGLVPCSIAAENDGLAYPVAVLAHHFERCYVRKLVRLHYEKPRWVLSENGLEDPATEPWFLIRAVKHLQVEFVHFIVNGDMRFYPLMVLGESVAPEPALDKLALLSPEYWKQTMNWTDFSAADGAVVEAAIQAFLHRARLQ